MADELKFTKEKSPLIGAQAKPTTLDDTTKLDIDTNKEFIDSLLSYGIAGNIDIGELERFTTLSNNREQQYQLIDTMYKDSEVSVVGRTISSDVCSMADNGHIIWAESSDPKISKFVNYLLNIMNADKNMFSWTQCLVKYGDVYLKLFRESDYQDDLFKKDKVDTANSARNILNESLEKELKEQVKLSTHPINDPYSYYVEMVADPGSMFEVGKFGKTYGYIETPNQKVGFDYTDTVAGATNQILSNYRMKSNDVNVYQADDFVHACLEDDINRYPETVDIFKTDEDYNKKENATSYQVRRGKSMFADVYKIWREKSLLESATLLYRCTRSSVIRKVQVEVGNMPKEQATLTLKRVKELFENKNAYDAGNSMTEYANPGPIINNVYFTTHNGQGAITVEDTSSEVNIKDLADLDRWTTKYYSAFGVPKQFFGWTDDSTGFNGGTSLSIISSVYSNLIKKVQNALIQMVTDAINLFLINRGYKAYLNNFVIKMKGPVTQEEKDYRESLTNRINAANNLISLCNEVEDKARKLEIVKSIISSLGYGDEITNILQKEIDSVKEADKKAAEEAAAAKEAELEETTTEDTVEEVQTEDTDSTTDMDLGNSGLAPVATESLSTEDTTVVLNESQDLISSLNDDLPTPEQANESIDFSENK